MRHPVRAIVAVGSTLVLGGGVAALFSPTPLATFALVVLAPAALLAVPFTIAGVVHLRARRRREP
ncbi:hypothetical protein [Cellulomonas sp. NPDC058312]|uniref:hypothetical protein n=1 Tax=Cellulomonas sp. NPDC058312 TaxID=3346441 RepID=UPI0036E2CF26